MNKQNTLTRNYFCSKTGKNSQCKSKIMSIFIRKEKPSKELKKGKKQKVMSLDVPLKSLLERCSIGKIVKVRA